MQIWPAIDIRGGKCVRLVQGDYARETVFGEDPAEMARRWVGEGAECLHLVDLDGARSGKVANWATIEAILTATNVPCELGGGVRDEPTIARLLELGLARVVLGTAALADPAWVRRACRKFPGRIALGIDARGGRVATEGWRTTSDTTAVELASAFAHEPLAAIIYTDIETDGTLGGPNFTAIEEMAHAVELPVVASGGITTLEDVCRLAEMPLAGCIIGRALYEGKFKLADALAQASSRDS
jgi:phosphoribosylformimino-5-aminoimidazole carboxamide ribotide isomerase